MVALVVGAATSPGWALALEKEEARLNRAYFRRFGRDMKDVVTAPSHWRGKDLACLAFIGAMGIGLFASDQKIGNFAQEQRTEMTENISSVATYFGNGGVLLGLSAALYAVGEIGEKDVLRRTALLSFESLAGATFFIWTTKFIIGRARPYTGDSSRTFKPFSFSSDYWSLPSGHAASAFAVATTIAGQVESPIVDSLAYGLATLAALSRVHDHKHWASDVFIGSAIGYFAARKILALNRKKNDRHATWALDYRAAGERQMLSLKIAF